MGKETEEHAPIMSGIVKNSIDEDNVVLKYMSPSNKNVWVWSEKKLCIC